MGIFCLLVVLVVVVVIFLIDKRDLFSGVPRYESGNSHMKMSVFTNSGSTRVVNAQKLYHAFGESPHTTIFSSGDNSARIGFLCFAIAPTRITTLTALVSRWGRCVELSWTSPWGDTPNGKITGGAYRIRYSTYANVKWDSDVWNSPQYNFEVVWSTNTNFSVSQFRRLTGLIGGTTYYIRIWARDNEFYNWSNISNEATMWAQWVILSVYIVPPTTYYFDTLSPAQTDISTSALVIENDGNVYEDFGIKIDTKTMENYGTVWRINDNGVIGNNEFVLEGIFYQNLRPKSTDFSTGVGSKDDIMLSEIRWSSDIVFCSSSTVSDAKGFSVVPFEDGVDDRRLLWLKITAPLSTATTQQQIIPIHINVRESLGVGPPP